MQEIFVSYVVDDDPAALELIANALCDPSKGIDVFGFSSVEKCQHALRQKKPDLFLVDLRIPGVSGLDFCRWVSQNNDCHNIPIMIVSGVDTIEARLEAYESGAVDFLIKPFQLQELRSKVDRIHQQKQESRQLQEITIYAQNTAMTALSTLGELGIVLRFLGQSFSCIEVDDLLRAVFVCLQEFGLRCAVQIRINQAESSIGEHGACSTLETSILNHVRTMGRISEFRNRVAFNYPRFSLLVQNMPEEDEDRRGRLRDHLALLAEGVDARLHAIENENINNSRKKALLQVLTNVEQNLQTLRNNQLRDRDQSMEVINHLHRELIRSFMHLGMSETQEEFLAALVGRHMDLMFQLQLKATETTNTLEFLAQSLMNIDRFSS